MVRRRDACVMFHVHFMYQHCLPCKMHANHRREANKCRGRSMSCSRGPERFTAVDGICFTYHRNARALPYCHPAKSKHSAIELNGIQKLWIIPEAPCKAAAPRALLPRGCRRLPPAAACLVPLPALAASIAGRALQMGATALRRSPTRAAAPPGARPARAAGRRRRRGRLRARYCACQRVL